MRHGVEKIMTETRDDCAANSPDVGRLAISDNDNNAAAIVDAPPQPRIPLDDHPDVIALTVLFVCKNSYLFVAGVSKQWKAAWGDRSKTTSLQVAPRSPSRLAWAKRCGCRWDLHTCAAAASSGSLEALKYARGKQCGWNGRTCEMAAKGGHLEVLKWCRANHCPWGGSTRDAAASGGYLNILRWCQDNNCPWGKNMCALAARGGHLRVLRWCRAGGCPWDGDIYYSFDEDTSYSYLERYACHTKTSNAAAAGGHLEVLKWCKKMNCPWGGDTLDVAARMGHLHVIKWCRANGCPWGWTCEKVAETGHLAVLEWCKANGCSWRQDECLKLAYINGHTHVVIWLLANQDSNNSVGPEG